MLMKIEKGIISSSQLTFLIIGLFEANILTAAFISGIAKQNTWIVLIIGFLILLFMLFVYTSLNKIFPDKNLIEVNDVVYGKYFGKIMSILYIYYFWFVIAVNLRFITDFFTIYLFSKAWITVLIVPLAAVCIYTVRKGIEVIARVGFILSVLSIIVAIAITLLTIKDMDLSNFLPVILPPLNKFMQAVNLIISLSFGEIVVFLMYFPYVNDKKQVRKAAFLGVSNGVIYFLSIILRNIAVLGNIASMHVLPSYQVARLINLGEIITRMEVLIAVALLFNVFLKICIFYYATVLSIAQCLNLQSYKPIVIPVGIISLVLSITMLDSPTEMSQVAASTYDVYAVPFIIIFPIITLIIAKIKNAAGK